SACKRSIFPFDTARRVNSPGSASRAPAASSAAKANAGTSWPPCKLNSTRSSPVYECGPVYTVTTPRSTGAPVRGSRKVDRYARRGVGRHGSRTDAAMACAEGPLTRSTASAPRPGGVATATIVSSAPGSGSTCAGRGSVAPVVMPAEREGRPRLEDLHILPPVMISQMAAQLLDRAKGTGGQVLKGPPMIGDEITRPQP